MYYLCLISFKSFVQKSSIYLSTLSKIINSRMKVQKDETYVVIVLHHAFYKSTLSKMLLDQ